MSADNRFRPFDCCNNALHLHWRITIVINVLPVLRPDATHKRVFTVHFRILEYNLWHFYLSATVQSNHAAKTAVFNDETIPIKYYE